jgi:hypothetical protein
VRQSRDTGARSLPYAWGKNAYGLGPWPKLRSELAALGTRVADLFTRIDTGERRNAANRRMLRSGLLLAMDELCWLNRDQESLIAEISTHVMHWCSLD